MINWVLLGSGESNKGQLVCIRTLPLARKSYDNNPHLASGKNAYKNKIIVWVCCDRLASGDSEGRVVVWDIATATPVIALEDPLTAAQVGSKRTEPGKGGAVRGLAWVCAHPARLAIVLANGMFLVWDVQGAHSSPC